MAATAGPASLAHPTAEVAAVGKAVCSSATAATAGPGLRLRSVTAARAVTAVTRVCCLYQDPAVPGATEARELRVFPGKPGRLPAQRERRALRAVQAATAVMAAPEA